MLQTFKVKAKGCQGAFFSSEAFRPDKPSVSVNGVVGVVCSPSSFQHVFFHLSYKVSCWLANSTETLLLLVP